MLGESAMKKITHVMYQWVYRPIRIFFVGCGILLIILILNTLGKIDHVDWTRKRS